MTFEKIGEAFKDYGGVYDVSNARERYGEDIAFMLEQTIYMIDHWFNLIIEDIKKFNYSKRLDKVSFGIINNNGFLAKVAKSEDGEYFVGISLGAILAAIDLYSKMMARSNSILDVGDPSKETEDLTLFDTVLLNTINYAAYTEIDYVSPKCDERKKFYLGLVDLTLWNIAFHELGHILHGHYDFRQNEGSSILENSDKIVINQVLEWGADSFATYQLFDIQNHLYYSEGIPWNEFLKKWTLAIFVSHRMFRLKEIHYPSDKNRSHPPGIVRITNSLVHAKNIFYYKKYDGAHIPNVDQYRAIYLLAIQQGEDVFEKIIPQGENFIETADVSLAHINATYLEDIRGLWPDLKAKLDLHAFMPLPNIIFP